MEYTVAEAVSVTQGDALLGLYGKSSRADQTR